MIIIYYIWFLTIFNYTVLFPGWEIAGSSRPCTHASNGKLLEITSGRKHITTFHDDLLVGGILTHLKNMSSSVGNMTFPIYEKIKHVPNHQPADDSNIEPLDQSRI